MFKIKSEALKGLVSMLVKSARKAGIGDKTIYIRTLEDGLVSFYYHGLDISVEKKIPCKIEESLEVATSIGELDVKVSALPDGVEVTVERNSDGTLHFNWGNNGKRKSGLRVDVLPESSPMVEVPPFEATLNWKPGVLHNLVRYVPSFCLNANNSKANQLPNALGPNFMKDDKGRVVIRATDTIKGVIIYPKHMEWFEEEMSIHIQSLQGVADVIPSDAEIQVGLSGGTVVIFKAGYTTAVCRTLIGKFPPVEKQFNNKLEAKLNIDRLELIEVCKRVKLLAPTAPLLQLQVTGDKVLAIIPDVLEQALPASVEGDLPSFALNAIHLEMVALLYAMAKSSDELTLYVDKFDLPVSIGIEGREDIQVWCGPHISQFVREKNGALNKPIPMTV